jgi:arginyl-tRNA synthetase
MLFEIELRTAVQEGMSRLFHLDVLPDDISIQPTRKDFDGDLTVVVFNLAKKAGKSPDAIWVRSCRIG